MNNSAKCPVVWFEIRVSDLDRTMSFYGELLGWEFEPLTDYDPEYITIDTGVGSVGGAIVRSPDPRRSTSPSVILYVEVRDLDSTVERAVSLGATVHRSRTEITKTAGSFVLIHDPEGNTLGLWSASAGMG